MAGKIPVLYPRLAQDIVGPKTTLSELYSYTLNINRIFIKLLVFFIYLESIFLEKNYKLK